MNKLYSLVLLMFLHYCVVAQPQGKGPILVLGVAQDGGYPHAGCAKQCCAMAWKDTNKRRFVTSLALIDEQTKRWWLFEATPDIKEQLEYFRQLTGGNFPYLPEGIFITHAHIGHYTGLMQLGKEVMNTKEMKVYVLPKMKQYLENNGPWSQLVSMKNIVLKDVGVVEDIHGIRETMGHKIADGIGVSAFSVPHRDEYSETAGFYIGFSNKKYVFIPDIDKWSKWKMSLIEMATVADVLLVDGTFNDSKELPGRSIAEVPHPYVPETMKLFDNLAPAEREKTTSKIHFIHFNHTNALMWDTMAQNKVRKAGFGVARQGQRL
jgi:pyrroloquinoline quinone biosynthesis protein B